jgi:hypothetical protein
MSPDRDDRSEAPDPDVDALFAQIVAGWDDEQTSPVPPWPATEDLPDRTGPDSPAGGREAPDRTDPTDRRQSADRRGDRGSGRGDRPDRRAASRPDVPGSGAQARDRSGAPGQSPAGPAQTRPGQTGPGQASGPTDPGQTDPGQTGPASGRASGPASDQGSGTAAGGPASGTAAGPPAPGPRDWAAADEPDEGFVPPEPPPLPRGDLVGRLAWAGVLFGPAFLLLTAFLWDDAGPLPLALGTLAFVGGFVTLVARMPARRDDSDDDGAVV